MEDYKKLYEQTQSKMKEFIKRWDGIKLSSNDQFTEELKQIVEIESEDEKIRKEIIEMLKNYALEHYITKEQFSERMTWLEKQGEQKSADKSEPKFHEGDWVVTSYGKVNQVIAVDEDGDGFTLDDDTYFSGSWKDSYHLWTIQDAKDGDVLVASDESLFIFAKVKDNAAYYHFSLCKNGSKEISDGKHAWETVKGCHPATKEQRDTLFAKMKEAGYTWNADKKQLKKIEQKPAEEYSFNIESELFHQLTKEQQELWKKEIEQAYNAGVEASDEWSEEDEKYIKDLTDYFIGGMSLKHTEENIIAWIKSLGHQQKQEWSEEDEEYLRRAINAVKNTYPMTANWLKSLKDRVQPKQEWSEEDMFKVQIICKYLNEAKKYYADITEVRECMDWLKSIRPQNRWKPSDEQLDALQYVYRNLNPLPSDQLGWNSLKTLELMYQDLKKLKEE